MGIKASSRIQGRHSITVLNSNRSIQRGSLAGINRTPPLLSKSPQLEATNMKGFVPPINLSGPSTNASTENVGINQFFTGQSLLRRDSPSPKSPSGKNKKFDFRKSPTSIVRRSSLPANFAKDGTMCRLESFNLVKADLEARKESFRRNSLRLSFSDLQNSVSINSPVLDDDPKSDEEDVDKWEQFDFLDDIRYALIDILADDYEIQIENSPHLLSLIFSFTFKVIDCKHTQQIEPYTTHAINLTSKYLNDLKQLQMFEYGEFSRVEDIVLKEIVFKGWEKITFPYTLHTLELSKMNFEAHDMSYLRQLKEVTLKEVIVDDWSKLIFPEHLKSLHLESLDFASDLRYIKTIDSISMINVTSSNWNIIQFPNSLHSLHMESNQQQFPYASLVSEYRLSKMSRGTSVTWCDHYSGAYYFFDHDAQRIVETEI